LAGQVARDEGVQLFDPRDDWGLALAPGAPVERDPGETHVLQAADAVAVRGPQRCSSSDQSLAAPIAGHERSPAAGLDLLRRHLTTVPITSSPFRASKATTHARDLSSEVRPSILSLHSPPSSRREWTDPPRMISPT